MIKQKKYEILYLVCRVYWDYLSNGKHRILRYGALPCQRLSGHDEKSLREKVMKKERKNLKDVEDQYRDYVEVLKLIEHKDKYSLILPIL